MNILRTKENRIHCSEEKPFSHYECVISDTFLYVPMHWHDEFEINYIRDGCAEFICGDEKFISQKGDIIIIPPNMMHSVYMHKGCTQTYDTLVFSAAVFGGLESERYMQICIAPLVSGNMRVKTHITPKHHYYPELQKITENIFSCAKGDTPQLDMLLKSELIRLFWLLETEADNGIPVRNDNEMLRPVFSYIWKHFREDISIKQLADTVHLSPSYFMGQFRKCVGFSAKEYISHYRISYACKALADTSRKISEIAFDSGFKNLSNFNRLFFRIIGCTPTDYRNSNKNE